MDQQLFNIVVTTTGREYTFRLPIQPGEYITEMALVMDSPEFVGDLLRFPFAMTSDRFYIRRSPDPSV